MNWYFQLILVTGLFGGICLTSQNHNSSGECAYNLAGDFTSARLCNDCLEKIMSNQNAARSLIRELQRRVLYSNQRIILTDLIEDVLYLIIDQLDILDTLNLLRAYQNCPDVGQARISAVAGAIFRRKYKDYKVIISLLAIDDSKINIKNDSKTITIHTFKESKSMLRHLGSEIQRLELRNPTVYPSQSHLISILTNYLNKYATKSLTHLELDSINEDTFVHFKRPFNELVELSVDIRRETILTGNVTLHLFPRLRRLKLQCNYNMDYSFILYDFPLLEHLKLFIKGDGEQFELMLKKMPQIRSLELNSLSDTLCKIINSIDYPNLQKLVFLNVWLTYGARYVQNNQFSKNIKHLEVRNRDPGTIEKLSFPCLETLSIVHTPQIVDEKWPAFFRRHQHVKHLKVTRIYVYDIHIQLAHYQKDFLTIFDNLQNLTEITFEYSNEDSSHNAVNLISKTIEKNKNLVKLNILAFPMANEHLETLRESFEANWNMSETHYHESGLDVVDLVFLKNN